MSAVAPTYELAGLQQAVREGAYKIMFTATADALQLGMDEEDIRVCMLALVFEDFYKTMPSQSRPGLYQDVYHPTYNGVDLYVKLQGSPDGHTVVIAFKRR